jgi:hypothetical protein
MFLLLINTENVEQVQHASQHASTRINTHQHASTCINMHQPASTCINMHQQHQTWFYLDTQILRVGGRHQQPPCLVHVCVECLQPVPTVASGRDV